MLVRRPQDPKRFNGIVVFEWLNVTGQREEAADYAMMQEELIRDGYARIGVGAQVVGVNAATGLKATDPVRCATVNHPGDAFSYDIGFDAATLATLYPSRNAFVKPFTRAVNTLEADGYWLKLGVDKALRALDASRIGR